MADVTLLNADDDLGKLMTLINPLAGYWVAIAVQLGMTSHEVNIKKNPGNVGPADFLRELLTRWLNQENPSPTLEALCRALRADREIIGGGNVARQLEENFTSRRESGSGSGPTCPAARPGRRPVTDSDEKSNLPLQPAPSTTQTKENLDSTVTPVAVEDVYSMVKCAPPLVEQFLGPQFDEDELEAETNVIRSEFNILFTRVRRFLTDKGVTVRDFMLFLKRMPGYPTKSLPDTELSTLCKSSDLIEVFETVADWCSWFNHSFLGEIIAAYCTKDEEIRKAHRDFCAHLRTYCKHRVKKIPFKNRFGVKRKIGCTSMLLKVDREWKDIQLEQLEEVIFSLARILKVPRHTLHLHSIENGCVQLTLTVPNYIPEEVFPLTAEQEVAVVDIGVTDIQCGSYHFSQQEDAPSRFLPRAFSGLQESVQERTQDLSREHQPPPQLFQCKGFHHITYNILSYLDDARSLCRAEQVCSEWYRVIAVELLWKKLIERKVKTDPVWRGLSQRRGWDKYLFRRVPPSEGITHEFYRQLYPNIVRDINNLQINWKNGHHTLTHIECGEKAKGGGVCCLQYDNKRIISGHEDNTIKIWDRKSLKCSTVLQGHTESVECLQYDDRVIITGSGDSTIRVWDMNDGSMLNKLVHHRGPVYDLKFNSDTMVTGSMDGTVAVWDMMSPMDIFLRKELKGHGGYGITVDFDEKYIVSGSFDDTIKVWQTSTGECVRTLQGHRDSVCCLQYRGNHIVSGSLDHTIRIWDIESGACLKILEGHNHSVRSIRFDGRRIVSGSLDGEIKVWDFQAALDPRSQADTLCLQTLRGHSDYVNSLQLDDFQIVSGSYDATILIWDFLDPVPPGPIDTDQSDNKKALT